MTANFTINDPDREISPECDASSVSRITSGSSFSLVEITVTNLGSRADFVATPSIVWSADGTGRWQTFGLPVPFDNGVPTSESLGPSYADYSCTPSSFSGLDLPVADEFNRAGAQLQGGESVTYTTLLFLPGDVGAEAQIGVSAGDRQIGYGQTDFDSISFELVGAGPTHPNRT